MIPFAVIVPTKNRRVLLERAVKSVLEQDHPLRLIIVDDGSTDSTAEFLALITDPRVSIIRHPESRGVNAARNAALRTVDPREWAVLLDDDDALLPAALARMSSAIAESPAETRVVFFATRIATAAGDFVGGYQFAPGERWYDPTYFEVAVKDNMRGDSKPALSGVLFAEGRFFAEDVNGFESEFYLDLARDGIRIRYCAESCMQIDQSHGSDRLSNTAAAAAPRSFSRVLKRILRNHRDLYRDHPAAGYKRATDGLKVSIRAFDTASTLHFFGEMLHYLLLSAFGSAVEKRR